MHCHDLLPHNLSCVQIATPLVRLSLCKVYWVSPCLLFFTWGNRIPRWRPQYAFLVEVRTTELSVHAFRDCHKNKAEANILKFVKPKKFVKTALNYTWLSHFYYTAAYTSLCHRDVFKSIYTKDDGSDCNDQNVNKVLSPKNLLICLWQLGGDFDTAVVFE